MFVAGSSLTYLNYLVHTFKKLSSEVLKVKVVDIISYYLQRSPILQKFYRIHLINLEEFGGS